MEPLSCILHGIDRFKMDMAEHVVIYGAGPIGLLFLQMVRLKGATRITILEKQTARAEMAEKLGADRVVTRSEELKDNLYDAAVDTTGDPAVIEKSIDNVRRGGKILLFGVSASGKKITLEGFKLFHKGLSLISSFTSVRNSYQAIALLQSKQLNISDLISHTFPLSDFERGVITIENGEENVRKVMILPQQ